MPDVFATRALEPRNGFRVVCRHFLGPVSSRIVIQIQTIGGLHCRSPGEQQPRKLWFLGLNRMIDPAAPNAMQNEAPPALLVLALPNARAGRVATAALRSPTTERAPRIVDSSA
jgi:hypothetical protein